MGVFNKFLLITEKFEDFVMQWSTIAFTAIVFAAVITRYFFNYSWAPTEEVVKFIRIWVAFIGMAYADKVWAPHQHVRDLRSTSGWREKSSGHTPINRWFRRLCFTDLLWMPNGYGSLSRQPREPRLKVARGPHLSGCTHRVFFDGHPICENDCEKLPGKRAVYLTGEKRRDRRSLGVRMIV